MGCQGDSAFLYCGLLAIVHLPSRVLHIVLGVLLIFCAVFYVSLELIFIDGNNTDPRVWGRQRESLIGMTGFSCLPLHLPTDFVVYFCFHLDSEEAWKGLADRVIKDR